MIDVLNASRRAILEALAAQAERVDDAEAKLDAERAELAGLIRAVYGPETGLTFEDIGNAIGRTRARVHAIVADGRG